MMRLKHILGPSIPISEARVYRLANTRAFYVYAFVFVVILAMWHPLETLHAAPLHIQIIFWLFGYMTWLFAYTFIHLGILRFSLRMGIATVSETLVMYLSLAFPLSIQLMFLGWLGVDVSDWQEKIEFLMFIFVLAEIGAFGYLSFGDEALFPEIYETPDERPDPAHPREIFLRGTSLLVAKVDMISASEEGIEVLGMGQTWAVARPFGIAVSELPVDLGFQIHRSIWISRDLAQRHRSDGRRLYVILSDGRRLPVARSRQREFQNWVRMIGAKEHRPIA